PTALNLLGMLRKRVITSGSSSMNPNVDVQVQQVAAVPLLGFGFAMRRYCLIMQKRCLCLAMKRPAVNISTWSGADLVSKCRLLQKAEKHYGKNWCRNAVLSWFSKNLGFLM